MSEFSNVWQIGDVKITRVLEGERAGELAMLPDATPEALQKMDWLRPHFANEKGEAYVSIHALVIDTGDRRIVVDTCLGNDKERIFPHWAKLQTRFLEQMEEAGYPPDSIDTVLCTHMHTDHVGWNTMLVDGEWVPTFKNARYLFGREEWAFTEAQLDQPIYAEFIIDSIKPVIDAGLVDFVEMDMRVCDQVWLEPTPGHTPGHVSVHIESKGKRAVITGDIMHHPCQMEQPRWECTFDWKRDVAENTRERMLAQFADEGMLVFGTHFATPSAGHVVRKDGAFRFEV